MELTSSLPQARPDASPLTQLLLWFPMNIERTVVPYLNHVGHVWSRLQDGRGIRLELPNAQVHNAVLGLRECVTPEEAAVTKALRLPHGDEPEVADLLRVTTLHHLSLLGQSRWLNEILKGDRLVSYFQPIVHAADTSRVFAYEALMRGRDAHGNPVAPMPMIHAARASGLTLELEVEAQRAALRGMVVNDIGKIVFMNINPASVAEGASALADTCAMIDALGIPHRQVVFEIVEMDSISDVEAFGRAMQQFRKAGFRFALDDLGSGYSGLNLVHQLRPDFIKLDMALVRGVHLDPYKAVITQMVLELSRRLAIQTIAEGVEHLGELEWLRENGVDFVQGFLIAKPSNPPALRTPVLGKADPACFTRVI